MIFTKKKIMNYKRQYDLLISSRKDRVKSPSVYYEKHHILMKCKGGTDDEDNLVFLTAKEHFLAHRLLWQIYRDYQSAYAFTLMAMKTENQKRKNICAREYAVIKEARREASSELHSQRKGALNHRFIHFNDEQISDIKNSYILGEGLVKIGRRYNCSKNVISRILKDAGVKRRTSSEIASLRIISDETKKKHSDAWKGEKNPAYGKSLYDIWSQKFGEAEAARLQLLYNEQMSYTITETHKHKKLASLQ